MFKNSLLIYFVLLTNLEFILSIPAENNCFRLEIILIMPAGSIVIAFISGQERAENDGTLGGSSLVKTDVKNIETVLWHNYLH